MGIYLDNAATTYMYPEVVEAMWPYYSREFYNPSAGYSDSKRVRAKIEQCRASIAEKIGANPEEIFFTSGGTESNNWVCNDAKRRRAHIISTTIEHKAMLNPLYEYRQNGGRVTLVSPNDRGEISVQSIKKAITYGTGLISVMMANNEIGTIEPIEQIGHLAKEYGIIFHSDGVQALGHIPIDVNKLNLDMLSASSHKFHGPKGVGFLYVRKDTGMKPMIFGGSQEHNMRAGTENVPGIVGMTIAAEISCKNLDRNFKYVTKVRDYMIKRLKELIPDIIFNGSLENRLPNNISFSIRGIDAQSFLVLLDMEGIYASAGSACSGGGQEISHVLSAINLDKEYAMGTIRVTIDETLSMNRAERVVQVIAKTIKKMKN